MRNSLAAFSPRIDRLSASLKLDVEKMWSTASFVQAAEKSVPMRIWPTPPSATRCRSPSEVTTVVSK